MVLLVPHIKTKWTRAMRASSGMILNAMILSSLNNFSVLTYRPDMRTMIIANAKPVHHHESRRVGLSEIASLAGGGVEYQSRGRSIVESHQLLQSSERKGRNSYSLSTKTCPRYHSILFPLAQSDVSLGHIVDSFYLRFGPGVACQGCEITNEKVVERKSKVQQGFEIAGINGRWNLMETRKRTRRGGGGGGRGARHCDGKQGQAVSNTQR